MLLDQVVLGKRLARRWSQSNETSVVRSLGSDVRFGSAKYTMCHGHTRFYSLTTLISLTIYIRIFANISEHICTIQYWRLCFKGAYLSCLDLG